MRKYEWNSGGSHKAECPYGRHCDLDCAAIRGVIAPPIFLFLFTNIGMHAPSPD